ncbi:MAG: CoA pyrophosphatase [Chloroflexota bacterium]
MTFPNELTDLGARLHHGDAPAFDASTQRRQAAVLVLLFPSQAGVSLLLIQRPDTLSHHGGQVALPGGAAEPFDRNLCETALREAREELGIRTDELSVLGRLDTVDVAVSGFTMTPFVAWSSRPPSLAPDPMEVARVIPVPLSVLSAPGILREETWDMRGSKWRVWLYRIDGHAIWGATARVLGDLIARLHHHDSTTTPPPGSVRALD